MSHRESRIVCTLLRCEVLEKVANATPHAIDSALFGLSKQGFELCEDLLDRVEVGAVGRQEEEPGARGADRLPDSGSLVGAEIIHDDNVAGLERWHQQLLDIGTEAFAVDRPVDDAGRHDLVVPECRKECHRPPMAMRNLSPERDAPSPPAMGVRVMLVFAQVSSMKTRRAGSIFDWCLLHQTRWRAISGRSCSVANTVFFQADALALEKPPERVTGHHDAAFAKLRQQRVQGQIRLFGQPCQ